MDTLLCTIHPFKTDFTAFKTTFEHSILLKNLLLICSVKSFKKCKANGLKGLTLSGEGFNYYLTPCRLLSSSILSQIYIVSMDGETFSNFSDNEVTNSCCCVEAAFCDFRLDVNANWIHEVVGVGLEIDKKNLSNLNEISMNQLTNRL